MGCRCLDETSTHRISEIDGLRAFAVMSVVVFHYNKTALPYGYLGVDVFFAISGYVITRSIMSQIGVGNFNLNNFFMRRIKRLFPALGAMVSVTVIFYAMLIPRVGGIKTAFAAMVGLSNIALWFSGQDYFGVATEWNPLTHTWSLGVEEQFYLAFPFLLFFLRHRQRLALGLFMAIAAVSLVSYALVWDRWPMAAFYLPIFRLWELLAGGFVYFACHALPREPYLPYRNIGLYILIIALMATMLESNATENVATVICTLIACGLLFLCSQPAAPNAILVHGLTQFIGRISYSVYLWHWPVAVFTKLLVPTGLTFPIYVVATVALSIGSYFFIERPLRHAPWSLMRESAFLTFPTITLATSAFVAVVWMLRSVLFLGPDQMLERSFLESSSCHIPGKDGLATCLTAGKPSGSIWLLGDSHAGNFLLPLKALSARTGHRLQHLTGRSLFLSMTDQCRLGSCSEGGVNELLDRIGKIGSKGDIVVLSFARDRLSTDDDIVNRFRKSLRHFVDHISNLGFQIIIIDDIPRVCSNEGEYFSSFIHHDACRVFASESRADRQTLSRIYKDLASDGKAKVVDLHDELCEQTIDGRLQCSNWKNGKLLYIDSSPHLTADASMRLKDILFLNLQSELTR